MTKDLNATIQQHQPLRVPSGWDKQERAFIVQLDEILDDIYRRFGRLKLSDMGKEIQNGITVIDDETGERVMISEAVGAINLKVEGNTDSIAEINVTTERIETRIAELGYGNVFMQPNEPEEFTKGDIWIQTLGAGDWQHIKDDYDDWQYFLDNIDTWQTLGGIPKMFVWDGHTWVEMYDAEIQTNVMTQIEQLADQIALRATVDQLNVLSGEVSQYASELVIMAQQIQSAVLAVNAKPNTYVSLADPTLTNTVHLGDTWDKHDIYFKTWQTVVDHYNTWQEIKDSHESWAEGIGDKTFIWDGVEWIETSDRATEIINETKITETATQISLLATQQATLQGEIIDTRAEIVLTSTQIKQYVANNYYGLVSGVNIVAAGIEISGSKYIKIKSGGIFTIDSGNFYIDASGNVVMIGTVYASGGTFAGALVAATGTFAGSLSAATGTFAGSLSAATGTFAGTMSAACITSGTMSADRISGGTLTLGGNNNTSGSLLIKNASGTQIGKWDKDGISAISGSIAGWDISASALIGNKTGIGKTTNDSDIAFWAGHSTASSGKYKVTQGGDVYLNSLMVWNSSTSQYEAVDFSRNFSNAVSYSSGSWSGDTFNATLAIFGRNMGTSVGISGTCTALYGYVDTVDQDASNCRGEVQLRMTVGGSQKQATTVQNVLIDASNAFKAGYNKALSDCGVPNGGTVYTGTVREFYDGNLDVYFYAVNPYYAHTVSKK